MTSTTTETAVDRFVSETRAFFAREADPERRWTQLGPILSKLLADPNVVAASKRWPACRFVDNKIQNLLFYVDPDYGFVINALVTDPDGYLGLGVIESTIHDHGSVYTLYGLLDGRQRIQRYDRIDDGSKPDYAELRQTVNSVCGPGEIDFVRPFEIHAEEQLGERTVAVIIRSERSDVIPQGRYNPKTNTLVRLRGLVQVPMPFYG